MSIFDRLVLTKIEPVSGTDSNPVPANDAIRVSTVNITPNVEAIDRQVIKTTMGNLPHMIGKKTATVELEVEVKGSGTAGVAPEMAPLLKACGLVEVVNAGVDVVYQPSTTATETATIYIYKDGLIWKLIGGKGKVSFETTIGQITMMKFTMQALYTAPVASAVPAGAAYQPSQPIIATPLDVFTEALGTIKVATFGFDDGNDLQEHYVIGEHSFQIAQRQPTATLTKDSVSTTAQWDALAGGLDAAISFVFGAVGNQFKGDFPIARQDGIGYSERAERDTLDASYKLYESVGDDQYKFTFS